MPKQKEIHASELHKQAAKTFKGRRKGKLAWKKQTPRKNGGLESLPGAQQVAVLLRANNWKYKPEHVFNAGRGWRFDFVIGETPEEINKFKIAIEYHGQIWKKGGHNSGYGLSDDLEKLNAAQLDGWTILYFTELFLQDHLVVPTIAKAIENCYTE